MIDDVFILYSRTCMSIGWWCIPFISVKMRMMRGRVLTSKMVVLVNGLMVRVMFGKNVVRIRYNVIRFVCYFRLAKRLNSIRSIVRLMMINSNRLSIRMIMVNSIRSCVSLITVNCIRSCVRSMMVNSSRVWIRLKIPLNRIRSSVRSLISSMCNY